MPRASVKLSERTSFKWGSEINVALDRLAKSKHQPKTTIVLDALAIAYPELRDIIYHERGWNSPTET